MRTIAVLAIAMLSIAMHQTASLADELTSRVDTYKVSIAVTRCVGTCYLGHKIQSAKWQCPGDWAAVNCRMTCDTGTPKPGSCGGW
jgi:hypothetical protein